MTAHVHLLLHLVRSLCSSLRFRLPFSSFFFFWNHVCCRPSMAAHLYFFHSCFSGPLLFNTDIYTHYNLSDDAETLKRDEQTVQLAADYITKHIIPQVSFSRSFLQLQTTGSSKVSQFPPRRCSSLCLGKSMLRKACCICVHHVHRTTETALNSHRQCRNRIFFCRKCLSCCRYRSGCCVSCDHSCQKSTRSPKPAFGQFTMSFYRCCLILLLWR